MEERVDRMRSVLSGCEDTRGKDMAYLDRQLLEHRTILISSEINREVMEKAVSKILLLEAVEPKGRITVFVNSPGGDADSGFAIYDALKFVSCPVRTICAGLCASAGVVVFLGSDKGERLTFPNSRFLIHQPSVTAYGQASDLEITADQIMKIRDRYNAIVAEETGILAKQLLKDANRDFWLSADKAKEYGLVDRIVTNRSEVK